MGASALRRFTCPLAPRHVLAGSLFTIALLAPVSPATAASASGPTWEAQAGNCSFSWQDSAAIGEVAYGIVESPAESGVSCELTLTDPSRIDLATVTVVNGAGVIYFASPGDHTYTLIDQNVNADAIGVVTISDAPRAPQPGAGFATVAGCTRSLENRDIPGHLRTYRTGWNIVSAVSTSSCSSNVGDSPSPYLGSASGVHTQVALVDPYGISLTKSATRGGAEISRVNVGDQILYRFTVTNTGLVPWTVTVADPLPGIGAVSCPAGPLWPGDAVTCTAPYTVTDRDRTAGSVVNTATATGLDNIRANATGASTESEAASATFTVSGTAASPTPEPSPTPGVPYSPSSSPVPRPQTSELAATGGNWTASVFLFGFGLGALGLGALAATRRRGPARTRPRSPTGIAPN